MSIINRAIEFADFSELSVYNVIQRNNKLAPFDAQRIINALTKAFIAVEGGHSKNNSSRVQESVITLTQQVIKGISQNLEEGMVHIEDIQDQAELALMLAGRREIAKAYVIHRMAHADARGKENTKFNIINDLGEQQVYSEQSLLIKINRACTGLHGVMPSIILEESMKNVFDGISMKDINHVLVMTARTLIDKEPNYTYVAARFLLEQLRSEALGFLHAEKIICNDYFKKYLLSGIKHELLDPELLKFDLDKLSKTIVVERNQQFTYLGMQTLYDRYLLKWDGVRFELPQAFFMRVAMGLAIEEGDREERAIEFYNSLSKFDFMPSTPTLFNSGTLRPQLSSCFLSTIPDDLEGIFLAIKDNALLSKFAGGLGNDWTPVRAMGSHIKSTNGQSSGIVPFLKVFNDTLVACNQSGKRRGSGCAYLETWHVDIEEFLELRKNTGDERRRTHDMSIANWMPDLFMQRVHENGQWTLFSPDEVPDLHELYGAKFKLAYEQYELAAKQGKLKISKQVSAVELWRKMLTMLFETGYPWLAFKDPCNIRSPQQHAGVVHSSNLCCIASDQRVASDRGLLTIGELYELGGTNKVVGIDGYHNASKMLLPRPNAPMVRIETKQGYSHKVTPDHKVWVKGTGWVEAQNLQKGDKLLTQQMEGMWGTDKSFTKDDIRNNFVITPTASVPVEIWRSDRDTVVSYLRFVYSFIHYNKNGSIIKLKFIHKPFLEELQILWANFGVESFVYKDDCFGERYTLVTTSDYACFIIEEQTLMANETPEEHYESHKRSGNFATFSHLTKLPNEDAYCLTVDSSVHAWTVNGLITKNTEITLNTKANEEVAVCNLSSINLPAHIKDGKLDIVKLQKTVRTAIRALDNVIDINYYAIPEARTANLNHRAIGLGVMGFQDALYKLRIPYGSEEAVKFADYAQEVISYHAISSSNYLAQVRGSYPSFDGSLWSQGILPIDSIQLLAKERGKYLDMDTSSTLDWDGLRERVKKGMRNSNLMAIAPTATISCIGGVTQSIEPLYQNLFVKSNLSGEFTISNPYLVRDLKALNLWDDAMINDLKYYDGRLENIDRIPDDLKDLYATAFEIEPEWLIEAASRRQKWIDQAQSLNLYILEPSGRKLDAIYKLAWLKGLKTTYYMRAMGATRVAKSTVSHVAKPQACNIDDESCESCQ